jgi:hypothetical protein
MKEMIALMSSVDEDQTKIDKLSTILEKFEESIFLFVRRIIKEDKGDLEEIFTWGSSFFMKSHTIVIDIESLLKDQSNEDQVF